MKTPEQFQEKAKEKEIKRWIIHNCSMCNYPCGFIFRQDGAVFYDNGCDCSSCEWRDSNWQEVADQYNAQTSDEYISEMNKFLGFEAA